mgnify:CR=1 FL=1
MSARTRATTSANANGLTQVVVGAAVETQQAIVERVARRDDEHGRLDAAPAEGPEDLKSVTAGQHQVEQDHVEHFRAQSEERVLAGVGDDRVRSLRLRGLPAAPSPTFSSSSTMRIRMTPIFYRPRQFLVTTSGG